MTVTIDLPDNTTAITVTAIAVNYPINIGIRAFLVSDGAELKFDEMGQQK